MENIKISPCETVVDAKKFIEAHTETSERHRDNWWFDSFKERLDDYNRAIKEKVRNPC